MTRAEKREQLLEGIEARLKDVDSDVKAILYDADDDSERLRAADHSARYLAADIADYIEFISKKGGKR